MSPEHRPGFGSMFRDYLELLKLSAVDWWNDNTFRLAASLAFYTVFSLAPIIIIATAVAAMIVGETVAHRTLVNEIDGLVGEAGALAVSDVLKSADASSRTWLATLFGLLGLMVGSTAAFIELQAALNEIWDVRAAPEGTRMIRKLLMDRLVSFTLVVGVGFLLLVSLVISAILAGAEEALNIWLPMAWVWWSANIVVSFLVVTGIFMAVYKVLPDVKITWRDVAVGAAVTALLFSGGKYLIGLYLGKMSVGSTYGAAGSFVVLLIWIYYSALICFFGAEFTQVYARRYGSQIRPNSQAVRIGEKSDVA